MIPQKTSLTVRSVIVDEPLALRIDEPTIVFTIESAVARAGKLVLDRSGVLVAARAMLTIESAAASQIAAYGFGAVLDSVEREYAALGFDRAKLVRWLR